MQTSIGVWTVLLQFLRPQEQQEMQLGNQFCYEAAVGRVITYFTLYRESIPFIALNEELYVYSFSMQTPSAIAIPSMEKISP